MIGHDFVASIVKGYKERFHWPVERDIYHTSLGAGSVLLLVVLVAVACILWIFNNPRKSHHPVRG